MDWKFVWSNNV